MTCERTVLLVVHTGRDEATEVARRVEKVLGDNNIALRVLSAEAVDHGPLHLAPDDMRALGVEIEVVDADERAAEGCELVLVLGGDGTFLRAAELARNVEIPVLGVNLGRIGFLAEAEADHIDTVLEHVIKKDYRVEERMTLDAVVLVDDVIEHAVDVIGLGFGKETDAAEINAKHRYFDVACEFGGPQECPVAAEHEHQFAAFRRTLIGVDHLDLDPEGSHIVGRQVQRTAVDSLRGEYAQSNVVVAQHFLNAASDFGRLIAAGVHDQQDGAFTSHCGPSATALSTACSSRSPLSGESVVVRR